MVTELDRIASYYMRKQWKQAMGLEEEPPPIRVFNPCGCKEKNRPPEIPGVTMTECNATLGDQDGSQQRDVR